MFHFVHRIPLFGFLLLALIAQAHSEAMPVDTQESPSSHPTLSFFQKIKDFLSLKSFFNLYSSSGKAASPTLKLDTIQLAEYDGYGAERHSVLTEDGFILETHRIHSKTSYGEGNETAKSVVIVHHDFLFDSRGFLLLGPGKALAYVLADAGYDVWLCNARGNTYSRKHATILPVKKDFWDFSYTEHGVFDLPAVIDYALGVTGQSKVHYIGHSMGTTNFLVMGSKRSEYLSKVKSFTALAPVTSISKGRSNALKVIISYYQTLARSFEMVGEYDLGSNNKWTTGEENTVCSDSWYKETLCSAVIFALSGESPNFDQSTLSEMFLHFPSGSSVKTFRHFGQNYANGFREYDYGSDGNVVKYGFKEPPVFNISHITVPTQIYYGDNDMTADPESAIELCKVLPNVLRCEALEDKTFGHIDFIGGSDVSNLYERIASNLHSIEEKKPRKKRHFYLAASPKKYSNDQTKFFIPTAPSKKYSNDQTKFFIPTAPSKKYSNDQTKFFIPTAPSKKRRFFYESGEERIVRPRNILVY